jgi:hypothetical protein
MLVEEIETSAVNLGVFIMVISFLIFGKLPGKSNPAVKNFCPTFASSTGFNTYRIGRLLDYIAQPDVLFDKEAGHPYLVPRSLSLLRRWVLLFHATALPKREHND